MRQQSYKLGIIVISCYQWREIKYFAQCHSADERKNLGFELKHLTLEPTFFYLFIYVFIYLFWAALGLSCSMQDLSLWRTGFSLVVVHGLSSCGVCTQLPHSRWDLSSQTRDQTHFPCIGRQILNYWTTREVPRTYLLNH